MRGELRGRIARGGAQLRFGELEAVGDDGRAVLGAAAHRGEDEAEGARELARRRVDLRRRRQREAGADRRVVGRAALGRRDVDALIEELPAAAHRLGVDAPADRVALRAALRRVQLERRGPRRAGAEREQQLRPPRQRAAVVKGEVGVEPLRGGRAVEQVLRSLRLEVHAARILDRVDRDRRAGAVVQLEPRERDAVDEVRVRRLGEEYFEARRREGECDE